MVKYKDFNMLKKIVVTAFLGSLSLFAGEKLTGAGATFPAPVYYDWAYNYKKATSHKVNYQSIGSGGGIEQISKRTVDFGASDEPLDMAKLDKEKLLQFPAVIGSIVIVHNIDGIKDEELKLSNSNIADIFLGKITKWNDPKILADNPKLNLPDEKITVVRRSDGSGTTYNFSYFLSAVSSEWKSKVGTGKSLDWPIGIGGKGNEGVTNFVKQTPNSVGYVENAYKLSNKLSGATIQTASGKWVTAREENFKSAAANANWDSNNHFYQILALQKGDTSYPIVAATFILLPREKVETNLLVVDFYNYSFENGDQSASKLGYVPLPTETKNLIKSYWKQNNLTQNNLTK